MKYLFTAITSKFTLTGMLVPVKVHYFGQIDLFYCGYPIGLGENNKRKKEHKNVDINAIP